MKERFKTFLLISLVGISILLAKNLWLTAPEQLINFMKSKINKEVYSYALSDMIAPNKYLLNFSETNHTIMYDDSKYGIWQKSKKNLIEALSSKDIDISEITTGEYEGYLNVRSVVFYFPGEMNTYILTRAWDIKNPNNIVDIMPNIDSIYIYLGNNNPFFVFSMGDKHYSVKYRNMDLSLLKNEISLIDEKGEYTYYYSMKLYGGKKDIFIPLEMDYSLPEIYVGNELYSYDESTKNQLAEKFIGKDIAYIRQIVEGNGATIYIYNQRVLKLNPNGVIEYFHTMEKKATERNLFLSLSTASKFLSERVEVPKGMYLVNVQEIKQDENLGYRLSFRYRVRGIPIVLGNREVGEYVNIEVFNDHVRSYKYYARKDMNKFPNKNIEEKKILSAFDVIDKNINFFEGLYMESKDIKMEDVMDNIVDEILLSIEDITLAYYDPSLKEQDERLIPIWSIRFNGREYAFDAYNGILVYER